MPSFATDVGGLAATGVSSEDAGSNPVLPAGLLPILEHDESPQVRAAAAGAATSLVKNAPLQKWMLLLSPSRPPTPSSVGGITSAGGSGIGIGERVESMMLRLHRCLVDGLEREKVIVFV